MYVSVGDVVKVKRGMTIEIAGEQTYIGVEDRFIVIKGYKHNVMLGYLGYHQGRGREFLLPRCFVETVDTEGGSPTENSLSKANLNAIGIQQGQVVKVQKSGLEDAQKWATGNGYHIELNADERFTVKEKRTKTVFIESKDRDWSMYLPKRFLEEATDECAALDVWQLKALIDIALDTGDKEWFNELRSKLSTLD